MFLVLNMQQWYEKQVNYYFIITNASIIVQKLVSTFMKSSLNTWTFRI